MNFYKIVVCQMIIIENKIENINYVVDMVIEVVINGVKIVVLLEMFNCLYENKYFFKFVEEYLGEIIMILSKLVEKYGIYLVFGSIFELEDGKIYNICYVFDKNGVLIGKYCKMYLFDIEVIGKVSFKELDIFIVGNDVIVIDIEYGKVGIVICYDICFFELLCLMVFKGVEIVILFVVFNMIIGFVYWELFIRMCVLDNQIFYVGVVFVRNMNVFYIVFGNLRILDFWGRIIV